MEAEAFMPRTTVLLAPFSVMMVGVTSPLAVTEITSLPVRVVMVLKLVATMVSAAAPEAAATVTAAFPLA
ncbi:hypothetical protein, partial [Acidiphilium multivorum]|uniref:hypothetical protein n=1 Tax=Acidiphilium multivorum TaxID=62140 RepID=UPI001F3641F5